MAIKVVSNTGGNYNASATWVGGILPATTDTIAFTATSGNLTINLYTTCAGIDFTNYVGTLTVNTTFIINGNINLGTGGYLVGGGNTMYAGVTGTITSNGTPWKGNFGFMGTSQTYTLVDDLTVNGVITSNVTTQGTLNGFTMYVKTSYSHASTGNLIGTTNLVFNGTGVWSHTSSGQLGLNTTINTSGTITCGANVRYQTGILTYTAGTIITTSSTLTIGGACTLNTNGIGWNNVNVTAGTVTNNSLLTINGTLSVGSTSTVTFQGTSGFTCANFVCTTPGRTINFATGKTYTINTSLTVTGASGSHISLTSTSTGALFILDYSASQDVRFCNVTWLNSNGGQPIDTSWGTLSNTQNWGIGMGNFL